MPRTRVARVDDREQRRIYIAGSYHSQQSADRGRDPLILRALDEHVRRVGNSARIVDEDRAGVPGPADPLAGLRILRDVVRVSKLVLRIEFSLDDRRRRRTVISQLNGLVRAVTAG